MYCVPDEQSYWSDRGGGFFAASSSKDCNPGEVCSMIEASVNGNFYTCKPGALTRVGHPCGMDFEEDWCPYPVACQNQTIATGGGAILTTGVCSPSLSQCAAGACPAGTNCRQTVYIYNGTTSTVCIGERALPRGAICAEDIDCISGLSCKPHTTITAVKVCQ